MDNTTVATQQYEVTLTRVIKVGSKYNMAPSEAFQGIEPGAVIVHGLYLWDHIDAATQDSLSYYFDNLDDIDDNDIATEYKTKPWVLYSHAGNLTIIDVMPVSIFAQHSVSQY